MELTHRTLAKVQTRLLIALGNRDKLPHADKVIAKLEKIEAYLIRRMVR